MPNDKGPSDEERRLFRESVGSIRPLVHDKAALTRPRPAPVPTQRLREERHVIGQLLSDECDPSEYETGDELVYAKPNVQRKTMQRLRRGKYSVRAELDLHGMTVPMARQALDLFLSEARLGEEHCVRIIHGKGHGSFNRQPILKGKVALWLSQRGDVLAYCSARPIDGGSGAVDVLLK